MALVHAVNANECWRRRIENIPNECMPMLCLHKHTHTRTHAKRTPAHHTWMDVYELSCQNKMWGEKSNSSNESVSLCVCVCVSYTWWPTTHHNYPMPILSNRWRIRIIPIFSTFSPIQSILTTSNRSKMLTRKSNNFNGNEFLDVGFSKSPIGGHEYSIGGVFIVCHLIDSIGQVM